MNPRITALVKTVLYPAILLACHQVVESWPALVAALGPHYAWLGGPLVVGIGGLILHQLESPGTQG